jgi:hypothetical protein
MFKSRKQRAAKGAARFRSPGKLFLEKFRLYRCTIIKDRDFMTKNLELRLKPGFPIVLASQFGGATHFQLQ